VTGDVVTAASDRECKFVIPSVVDCVHDIGLREAADDKGGVPVNHGVPDRTSLIVGSVGGEENGADEAVS
jgi:hypothetical protein